MIFYHITNIQCFFNNLNDRFEFSTYENIGIHMFTYVRIALQEEISTGKEREAADLAGERFLFHTNLI
jgi:hypothetical protein